jgi:hypothetical protein
MLTASEHLERKRKNIGFGIMPEKAAESLWVEEGFGISNAEQSKDKMGRVQARRYAKQISIVWLEKHTVQKYCSASCKSKANRIRKEAERKADVWCLSVPEIEVCTWEWCFSS